MYELLNDAPILDEEPPPDNGEQLELFEDIAADEWCPF